MAVFEKAKEMKEQAAAKAAELRDQATSKAAELKEQAASKATGLKDAALSKAGDVKDSVVSAAVDAKDASFNKLRETLDDFNAALPVIREAGYQVNDVAIELGIPPKIVAAFGASPDVTEERVNAVLEAHQDHKLTTMIVKSLYQAWRLQNSIKIIGMKPRGMSIDIGFVPSVTIKFA